MGEIADDHFVQLFWSEGTGVGGDGGSGPPIDHPAYGGMDAFISRRIARPGAVPAPQHNVIAVRPQVEQRISRLRAYDLFETEQEGKLRPCPCCGSKARVIEYPLGISCSRWSCVPGKLPVYLSEADAVAADFESVVERWNTAELNAERDALVWPRRNAATSVQSPA